MNDLNDRSAFESRLPDDPGYWRDLAARITASAEPILREHRASAAWWQPLARWSPAIGIAAAAAALLVVAIGPPDRAQPVPVSFERLLSPEDLLARAVVGGATAREISTLVFVESGGQR